MRKSAASRAVPFGGRHVGIRQKDWLPYALIAPAVLLVSAIVIYPAYTAVRVSLFDMNLLRLSEAKFIGLDNFKELFSKDAIFWSSVLGTVRWTGCIVIGQLALALPVALFLNLNFRGRGVIRTVVLIPWVVPVAVTSVIWVYVFDANFGVVNEILVRLGILAAYKPWLVDASWSFATMVLGMLWTGFPFMAIILLAALQALPQDVYEAARIDGAGPWQSFSYITLPQLMPTILLVVLLRTMWLSNHVDLIYLLTDGGPGRANYTLSIYSFMVTILQFNIGYASAVAVVLAAMLLIAAIVYTRQIEKTRGYM
jgi:multiple sugar transport system permease protein